MIGTDMRNTDDAYKGYFIAAELDQNGKLTGRFLVFNSSGEYVCDADTIEEARGLIDDLVDKPGPKGQRFKM